MPAVVRVKRRIDEEPLSAFVLNAKRRRVDIEEANKSITTESSDTTTNKQEITTLLKFAGTIKEQNDDKAITEYARLSKAEARAMVAQKSKQPTNLMEKARQEMRKHVQEQRFRVVNCMRTTLDADADADGVEYENQITKNLTIVDIEKQQTDNIQPSSEYLDTSSATFNENEQQPSTSAAALAAAGRQNSTVDSDNGYVYDLYFPENETFSTDSVDLLEDYHLSCRPLDYDYRSTWLEFQGNGNNADNDDDDDSEDSNREDYFTNDYPDEDDMQEDDDSQNSTEALRAAVDRFVFDDEDDNYDDVGDMSSSDDGDYHTSYCDPYKQTIDSDASEFCSDVDNGNVERVGEAMRRHKRNIAAGTTFNVFKKTQI